MDWADDVAYSVHDLEDGVHAGLIRLGSIDDAARRAVVRSGRAAVLGAGRRPNSLRCSTTLLDQPTLRDLAGYDGSFRAQAAAKRATSELTGRFAGGVDACHQGRLRPRAAVAL